MYVRIIYIIKITAICGSGYSKRIRLFISIHMHVNAADRKRMPIENQCHGITFSMLMLTNTENVILHYKVHDIYINRKI